MSFEEYAEKLFHLLAEIFGDDECQFKKERLKEIFEVSNNAWNKNLELLKGDEVEYLLVGEAPPWSSHGKVIYFYTTFDNSNGGRPITWIRGLWKSLIDEPPVSNVDENLKKLAKRKFLLIDSLPFAMPYTTKIRKTTEYKNLVNQCGAYFLEKIENHNIQWSKSLKVAIAFDCHGKALIERFPDGISLPNGVNIALRGAIATSGNGFPTMKTLSQKWCKKG